MGGIDLPHPDASSAGYGVTGLAGEQRRGNRDGMVLLQRAGLRFRLQIALVASDIAALLSGIILSQAFWLAGAKTASSDVAIYLFIPMYLLIATNSLSFSVDSIEHIRRGLLRSFKSVVIATIGVVLAAFVLKEGEHISRLAFTSGSLAGLAILLGVRMLFCYYVRYRYGPSLHSELVITDGQAIEPYPGVVVYDAVKAGLSCETRDPVMLDRIGRLLKPADRVVVACAPERRTDWAMILKGANIHGEIVSDELTLLRPLATGRLGDRSTVVVSTGSLDLRQRIIKRCLDITFSALALIVLTPVILIVSVFIRLDSSGPIFFVQDRVGRGNRLFGMFKFRSMLDNAADKYGTLSTSKEDRRVTRVGRFIRATSIDELPQLLNILKGDMSVVGPRPHAIGSTAGDRLFWQIDDRYLHRHACKPGLTGLAQVRGFRGATHSMLDLTNRLQADLEYMSGWTIWRDMSIIFATLRVVVHRNAY